jgi:hypothetical protein
MNSRMKQDRERLTSNIHNSDYKAIIEYFSPYCIVSLLDYKDCMLLANDMFSKNSHDPDIQGYGIKLFLAIRDHFSSQWHKDWKNDIFLGGLCGMVWLYSQEYEYYRQVYERLQDPPEAVLLRVAGFLNQPPGEVCISEEEAVNLVRRALEKKATYEAAIMMRSLSRSKGDTVQEQYWDTMAERLDQQNIHTDPLTPDIFS